jgi:molybdenum cofactor guanylyltransferase
MLEITGVILAGGSSTRMGRDKALIPIREVPMIHRIAETMHTIFEEVYIVSDHFDRYRVLNLPGLSDLHADCGPLGGIHTALSSLHGEEIFVVSCDMPFVSKELIEYLVGYPVRAPARVVQAQQRVHPLCGVYGKACLESASTCIVDRRLKMTDFLEEVGAEYVPVGNHLPWYHDALLLNINTPDDLARLTIDN